MGPHETRRIAVYLRNGSLWVGHFVASDAELDFGDDRFDSAHGLANYRYSKPASPANEADSHVQSCEREARTPTMGAQVLKRAA